MTVVDLCAGAGGKTLALAAEMGNRGRLIAADTDRGRLSRLPQRLGRAGVSIVETRLLDPGREAEALADLAGQADLVLVDAPCSGTGTWRRNPETRWRLTPERLERLVELQARSARSRRDAGAAGRTSRLCGLLAARRGGQGPGRGPVRAVHPWFRSRSPWRRAAPPGPGGCSPRRMTARTAFSSRAGGAMLDLRATG